MPMKLKEYKSLKTVSSLEEDLDWMIKSVGLPPPIREYKFSPDRKFKFDFAWPDVFWAVEVQGGLWIKGGGGHNHPKSIQDDYEKYNLAHELGWRVLQYSDKMIKSGEAILQLERIFK